MRPCISRFVVSLFVVFVMWSGQACAINEVIDFGGQTPGAPNWIVACANCGGSISINYASTMAGASPKWTPQANNFTSAIFSGMFGTSGNLIALQQLDAGSSEEQTTLEVTFPQPLPAGSKMFILDLDGLGERMAVAKNNGPFADPTMMETTQSANSTFGVWNAANQSITASAPFFGVNHKEAYVFDVTGARTVNITYQTGTPAIANVGFSVPVPEPAAGVLAITMALGVLACRGGKRRF